MTFKFLSQCFILSLISFAFDIFLSAAQDLKIMRPES